MIHKNLPPGSTVPKSGRYKCENCGPDGIREFGAKYALELMNVKVSPTELLTPEGRKNKTFKFFESGKKFDKCPSCGPSTGWSLVEEK